MPASWMGLLRRFFPLMARPGYYRQSYYLCYCSPSGPARSIKRSHMLMSRTHLLKLSDPSDSSGPSSFQPSPSPIFSPQSSSSSAKPSHWLISIARFPDTRFLLNFLFFRTSIFLIYFSISPALSVGYRLASLHNTPILPSTSELSWSPPLTTARCMSGIISSGGLGRTTVVFDRCNV